MNDIYDQLELYKNQLKAEHEKNTAAVFEDMVKHSCVDEEANAAKVVEIRAQEKQIAMANSSRSRWNFLRITLIILSVLGLGIFLLFILSMLIEGFSPFYITPLWAAIGAVAGGGSLVIIFARLNPIISKLNERLTQLRDENARKVKEAWDQMTPLNRLFEWSTISRIIRMTMPMLEFDPFFSTARLNQLYKSFGWSDKFNQADSILFCQSGEINSNPFVIGEKQNFVWGMKTYSGSVSISWEEEEDYTDSDGKSQSRSVTRSETLYASVEKPCPEYFNEKFVIFGSTAAPDLSFSRAPSSLASAGEGVLGKMRMKHAVSKLEKKSRNLNEGFSVMANRDFDALFGATDRDNEVQFRLLFTPLTQHEMVKLLKDKEIGFGDDFSFEKSQKINIVRPEHLMDIDISAAPAIFRNYELAEARKIFNDYSNNYFRHIFFAFAPLFTIPLYHQHSSAIEGHDNPVPTVDANSSFWEHEAIANYHGESHFKHADSVTHNILKTQDAGVVNGGRQVMVTAHGFRGEGRTDIVSQYGGDGKWHDIPISWVEYLPVSQTSPMIIRETDGHDCNEFEHKDLHTEDWQKFFQAWQLPPEQSSFRKAIVSFIPKS